MDQVCETELVNVEKVMEILGSKRVLCHKLWLLIGQRSPTLAIELGRHSTLPTDDAANFLNRKKVINHRAPYELFVTYNSVFAKFH